MGANTTEDMDVSSVVFVVPCVGSCLCDEMITLTEKSYRVCMCLIVRDLATSTMRRPAPELVLLLHRTLLFGIHFCVSFCLCLGRTE